MQVDNSCLNKSLLPLREVKKEQAKRICDKSGGSGFFFFFSFGCPELSLEANEHICNPSGTTTKLSEIY